MDEKKLVVKFVKDDTYKRFHATGFWGGVNPLGELSFDLFEDVVTNPERIDVYPNELGIPTHENVIAKDYNIERVTHAGVTIPMEIVPGLIDWLQSKVMENEERKKHGLK